MNDKKKYVFNEDEGKFNAKSTRYQTKRQQEKVETYEKMKREYVDLQNKLLNRDDYLEDDVLVFAKRLNTLKKYFSINKKKESGLKIPFYIDVKTVIFIEEKNCFKKKWIDMFGEEKIKERIKLYKELLPLKPQNVKFWNPF